MIAKLCHSIADFFVKENVISEKQREIYEYGFELSISSVIGIIIVIAIGLISGRFWESVVFYLVFCLTRLFCGGYHAPNYLLCKITLAGVQIAILLIVGTSSTGITVYHANYGGSCKVNYKTYTWANFAAAFTYLYYYVV